MGKQSIVILLFFLSSGLFAQSSNNARQALNEAGQASGHASASAGHSIAASGQVTSAAIAIPLSVGGAALGSVATVSTGMANESMKAATTPIGQPLPISDQAVTTLPPGEALKQNRINQ